MISDSDTIQYKFYTLVKSIKCQGRCTLICKRYRVPDISYGEAWSIEVNKGNKFVEARKPAFSL